MSLPENLISECFKDESKLNAMYSPIRSASINPSDKEIKVNFWKKIIAQFCKESNEYSFTLPYLRERFYYKDKYPASLSEVLDEMIKAGEIQSLENYLRDSPNTWAAYLTNAVLKRPILWAWNKFNLKSEQELYVYGDVICSECQRLLKAMPETKKNVPINIDEMLKHVKSEFPALTVDNARLLIHFLMKEGKADVKLWNDLNKTNYIIKVSNTSVKPITDSEMVIYKLEVNEASLIKEIEALEEEIKICDKEAKFHVLKQRRKLAKAFLRKKHEINARIEKKMGALHNVQVLLEKMKDAETDDHVMDSYKVVVSLFNEKYKEFNEDIVSEIMDCLSENLDIHEGVQAILSKPIKDEDEDDLEKELEELMESREPAESSKPAPDVEDIEKALDKLHLPDTPQNNPDSSVLETTLM